MTGQKAAAMNKRPGRPKRPFNKNGGKASALLVDSTRKPDFVFLKCLLHGPISINIPDNIDIDVRLLILYVCGKMNELSRMEVKE